MTYTLTNIRDIIEEVNLYKGFGKVGLRDHTDNIHFFEFSVSTRNYCIQQTKVLGLFKIADFDNLFFDNVIYDTQDERFLFILKHKIVCVLPI